MATTIVTTDNSDTIDFGCRSGKFALRPEGVLRALDSDNNGTIDPAYIPAGGGHLTVNDVLTDAAFTPAVVASVDTELGTRTFDCSSLDAL